MRDGWIHIDRPEVLDEAVLSSNAGPTLIYKHSHRCGISSMALSNLSNLDTQLVSVYWLDVINDRPMSMAVSNRFIVQHESPQGILILQGAVIWHGSHSLVRASRIMQEIQHPK